MRPAIRSMRSWTTASAGGCCTGIHTSTDPFEFANPRELNIGVDAWFDMRSALLWQSALLALGGSRRTGRHVRHGRDTCPSTPTAVRVHIH